MLFVEALQNYMEQRYTILLLGTILTLSLYIYLFGTKTPKKWLTKKKKGVQCWYLLERAGTVNHICTKIFKMKFDIIMKYIIMSSVFILETIKLNHKLIKL